MLCDEVPNAGVEPEPNPAPDPAESCAPPKAADFVNTDELWVKGEAPAGETSEGATIGLAAAATAGAAATGVSLDAF